MAIEYFSKYPTIETKGFATGELCIKELVVSGFVPDMILLDYFLDSENPVSKDGLEVLVKLEEICKKYIENNEPSALIYAFYGKTLLNRNRYREAEDFVTLALKLDPKNKKAKDVLDELTERRDNDLVKNV